MALKEKLLNKVENIAQKLVQYWWLDFTIAAIAFLILYIIYKYKSKQSTE